jgi:hypothetical protein
MDRLNNLSNEVNTKKAVITNFIDSELPAINKQLAQESIEGFTIITKEEFLEKEK